MISRAFMLVLGLVLGFLIGMILTVMVFLGPVTVVI